MIDRVRVEERIRRSAAYWWAIARALLALFGPGVVAEARRQLWQAVRSRPDPKSYAERLWRPSWWYPLLYRRPIAAAASASVVVFLSLSGLGFFIATVLAGGPVSASGGQEVSGSIRMLDGLDPQRFPLAVVGFQASFLAAVAPVAVALVSLLTGQTLRRAGG